MPRLHRTGIPSLRHPRSRGGHPPRRGSRLLPWIVTVLALLLVLPMGLHAQVGGTDPGSIRILLTNDDGYEAPGITAVHEALLADGYDVTLVAPSDNQSSSSGRISRGVLHYEEASPGVWHVDGSPATSVLLALALIWDGPPPDLVISGANYGQNIGTSTSSSGTVGAAIRAVREGIPAISVSAAITPDGARGLQGTREAYPAAAALVVDLVGDLVDTRPAGGRLLPEGIVLNVNHPALPAGEVRGIRVEQVSDVAAYDLGFEATGTPGEVETTLSPVPAEELPRGSEVRFLAEGWVVINLIDTRGHPAPAVADEVVGRLESIR